MVKAGDYRQLLRGALQVNTGYPAYRQVHLVTGKVWVAILV